MKKIIALILSLCMIWALCACGAEKNVPDKTIEWAIEDYLNSEAYGYLDYKTHITHDPDKKTKTDTVDIELEITLQDYVAKTSSKSTYQYNKSSELWELIRGGSWKAFEIIKTNISNSLFIWNTVTSAYYYADDDLMYISQNKDEVLNECEWYYRVDANSISHLISDSWCKEYFDDYKFDIFCFSTLSENDAKQLYHAIDNAHMLGGTLREACIGDSFNCSRYYFDWYSTVYIQNGNDVFLISYDNDIQNIVFYILTEVGYGLARDYYY